MAKGTKIKAKVAGMAKSAAAALQGEVGIFRRLKHEHGMVAVMLETLSKTTDGAEREERFTELRAELLAHSEGEKRDFYPMLRDDDDTTELIEEALEDHTTVEHKLEQLAGMDFASDAWAELFEDLKQDVEDHVEQEEHEIFPIAEELIDDDTAREIEERFIETKKEVLKDVA
jgi:hemerythrin superfamily protein